MSEPKTLQEAQVEFMRQHPGMGAGTGLPSPEMMAQQNFVDAINALSERIAVLERRMDGKDGRGEGPKP